MQALSSTHPNFTKGNKLLALLYGFVSHGAFIVAVCTMIWSLYGGLRFGFGSFTGWARWAANALLIAQFPLLHSLLLSRTGRPLLNHLAPGPIARQLQPTSYVLVASIQILLVFVLWSPSPDGMVWWKPQGVSWLIHVMLYAASWCLLGKSMWDAHLGIQTGYIGWLSIWRDQPTIKWPALPTSGLFRLCRQPIYFSFMLTLWTGPVWTLDKVVLGVLWTVYCYWGPLLKERRLERTYGEQFQHYRAEVPYWPGVRGAGDLGHSS